MQDNDTPARRGGQNRAAMLLFGAALLAGLGLRASDLANLPLSFDEAASVYIAKLPLGEVLEKNGAFNSSPPAMLVALHGVLQLGESEAFVRAVSVISGIATIPLVFLIVRQLHPAGLVPAVAALLFALSAQQVALSREFRVYALGELFGALGLLAVLMLARRPSWLRASAAAIAVFTGMQVQYAAAPFLAAAGLALVLGKSDALQARRVNWQYLALVAASGVLATVVVYQTALQYQLYAGRGSSYRSSMFAESSSFFEMLTLFFANTLALINYGLALNETPWSGVALGLFCIYGAVRLARVNSLHPYLLTTCLSLFVFMLLSAAHLYPYGATRQCLILTLPFYGLAAAGLVDGVTNESKTQRAAALSILILALFGFAMNRIRTQPGQPSTNSADVRDGIRRLKQDWQAEDVVFIPPGTFPLASYYASRMPVGPSVEAEDSIMWMSDERAWGNWVNSEPPYADQLDRLLRSNRRVWLLYSHYHPGEMKFSELAARRGWDEDIQTIMQSRRSDDIGEGVELYLFEPRTAPDPIEPPL